MIPYYWNGPLHEEICIITKDSVVGAPKFLVRTIFPHFDTLLCEHCINGHDKIVIIMKDVDTVHVEEAFKALASGDPSKLSEILEMEVIGRIEVCERGPLISNVDENYDIKQETEETESLNNQVNVKGFNGDVDVFSFLNLKMEENGVNKIISCEVCGFSSDNNQDMHWHKSTVHGKMTYPCEICDFVGKYPLALRNHREKEHGVSSARFPCGICSYKGRSRTNLNVHMKKKHEQGKFKCRFCDYRSNIKKRTKLHTELEHVDRQFECEKCTFKGASGLDLKNHRIVIHRKERLQCTSCDVAFKSKKKLESHVAVEHMGRLIECDLCSFQGKYKKDIVKHKRKEHSEKAPLVTCQFCQYESKLGSMRIHERFCAFKK